MPTELLAKPNFTWEPVTKEMLAETSPQIEPGVAAEALINRVEVDDNDDGSTEKYCTWQRYKIYDPTRADSILSLSYWSSASEGKTLVVEARLTLPSGEVKTFDQKSFLERSVENKTSGGGILKLFRGSKEKSTQRYLPIAGVERGAILDVQMSWKVQDDDVPRFMPWVMQFADVPIRKAEYIHWGQAYGALPICYTLNGIPFENSKTNDRPVLRTSTTNLPAMHEEPFSGPFTDGCKLTVIVIRPMLSRVNYTDRDVGSEQEELQRKTKAGRKISTRGQWQVWAFYLGEYINKHSKPTSRVKNLAAEICEGATTDEEKAHRIHNYAQDLALKYIHRSKEKNLRRARSTLSGLNDVLDFEKLSRSLVMDDFLMLALALYKAADLEAAPLSLPDSSFMRFNKTIVSAYLLPESAIGIYINGKWFYSAPHLGLPMPFNMLPPNTLGQQALVAQSCGEEFIFTPEPPPETTKVDQTGEFHLDASGVLSGKGQISLTGYGAIALRFSLNRFEGDETAQKREVMNLIFNDLFPTASVEVGAIEGLGKIEAPLRINFHLTLENFATRTDERLIFRPSVFRLTGRSTFTASNRQTSIVFPFKWTESDQVVLYLPEGYELEAPSSPTECPGKSFNYRVKLTYTPKTRCMRLNRTYTVDCVELPNAKYPSLKEYHEQVQKSDEHEIILKLKPATPTATQVTGPATGGSS